MTPKHDSIFLSGTKYDVASWNALHFKLWNQQRNWPRENMSHFINGILPIRRLLHTNNAVVL